MRDKQVPGDTYNYKEHVYADPLALQKEIEQDRRVQGTLPKPRVAVPPPVPSGPRKGQGHIVYAELEKKSNLVVSPPTATNVKESPTAPPVEAETSSVPAQSPRGSPKPPPGSIQALSSLFGGTIKRGQPESALNSPPPPPVPAVTESRNFPCESLDSKSDIGDISSSGEVVVGEVVVGEVDGEDDVKRLPIEDSIELPKPTPTFDRNEFELPADGFSPGPEPEPDGRDDVVIDVRSNPSVMIEIGAEIPMSTEGSAEAGTSDGVDGDAVKLIKITEIRQDSITPSREEKREIANPNMSDVASRDSATSGGSNATSGEQKKKKNLGSWVNSMSRFRQNLIMVTLFLFILFILISAVIIGVITYQGNS